MGDRANIIVIDDRDENDNPVGVVLYTHWSGSEIKQTVKAALAMGERWGDPPYLTRIIFDALRGDDTGTSGFGISSAIATDVNHPYLVVDVPRKAVFSTKMQSGDTTLSVMRRARQNAGVSFEKFSGLDRGAVERAS